MPSAERKPCWGSGRELMIVVIRVAQAGPIFWAQRLKRSGVQLS
jgi:hypothetical protein